MINIADNKIKYGLKNAHYAVITENTDGSITFGEPQHIKGAVSITLSPVGESTSFYADNIEYFIAESNGGYDGSIEMALIPDEFRINVLGEMKDSNGVLIETTDAEIKPFALLFEFNGDKKAKRHLLYYCKTSRLNIESSTKTNSIDIKTDKLTLKCRPLPNTTYVKAKTTFEINEDLYNNWFNEVYQIKTTSEEAA